MGCSSSKKVTSDPENKAKVFKRKGKKPKKNYVADPKYKAFIAIGAEGDPTWPQSMFIQKEQVKKALRGVDIDVRGDRTGYKEFCLMDKDFRNHVRFKDFCKFVKNHNKGKAYNEEDSSLSSSDIFEDIIRDLWREIDPERLCVVPIA